MDLLTRYREAAAYIQSRISITPKTGLILGSGLGELADQITDAVTIPYRDIPHFPQSTVHGHSSELVCGNLAGQPVCAMKGRFHGYEGYSQIEVTFPVRVMKLIGIEILIVTNAAGGINRNFKVGDVMLLNDHINLPGFVGVNPLMGPNLDSFGERFVSTNDSYDRALLKQATALAAEHQIPVHSGVYCYLTGPFFESAAELRFLKTMGADAVGMSTVPEVLVARHAGIRVLAMSGITNECILDLETESTPNHIEVLEAGKTIVPKMKTLIMGVLATLS